jgi:hypothetical protein
VHHGASPNLTLFFGSANNTRRIPVVAFSQSRVLHLLDNALADI